MDTLPAGNRLNVGDRLQSNSGRFVLVMQGDGNLVGYDQNQGGPFWATNTWGLPIWQTPNRTEMQGDGNCVLYTPANAPIWASGTDGKGGDRLVIQNDRNIVIYKPDGSPVWASNTWIDIGLPPGVQPAAPLTASKSDEVGWGKRMDTQATLYRDGRLVVDCYTKNDNWTGGLRGRVLVVCADGQGRSIWVSDAFECATRCSIPDFSCASYGRETFVNQFPDVIGAQATRLDIYNADNANFVDLRDQIIRFITATKDVLDAGIQAVLDLLKLTNP